MKSAVCSATKGPRLRGFCRSCRRRADALLGGRTRLTRPGLDSAARSGAGGGRGYDRGVSDNRLARLIEGIDALMSRLETLNIPMGIATASRSHWLEAALKRHGIEHRFAAVTTADDVTEGKPSPQVYLVTAKKLGVAPSDCVALEDSFQGLSSAKAALMYCIGLKTEGHLHRNENLSQADKLIDHPDRLTMEVLRSL